LSDPLNELFSIVSESKTSNQTCGITGLLLFDDTFFMQTIEGPATPTMYVFSRIVRDRRHRNVTPFGLHEISDRDFPGWHMELITPDETVSIVPDMRNLEFSYRRLREIQFMSMDVAKRRRRRVLH
jgi:hypothetical protein